ncbi:7748_t:CDS:2 [Funneliformis caledonium]|uniref:7748_t:CDS:1 n=1 Tax=Funneliformis caledonium TaxID=1117310 RepID=A0A9N9GY16_9GLOM|nr:7748_t:CDS:2 [Funneliformis caledonium]
MSKKLHNGKPLHKWIGYFYILDEKRNKTYKTAKCLACINTNNPSLIVEEMNNKREKCQNHLRDCSQFKAQFNEEEWASIYTIKKAHSKKRSREVYDDNQDVTSLVSILLSINLTRSLSTQSTQPTFTDTQLINNSILFYMPRLITKSTKHWHNLVLRATVSCSWLFRWVENDETRE